jgi:hypothetical protein
VKYLKGSWTRGEAEVRFEGMPDVEVWIVFIVIVHANNETILLKDQRHLSSISPVPASPFLAAPNLLAYRTCTFVVGQSAQRGTWHPGQLAV